MGKKGLDQARELLMRDVFAIIWVILIIVIILLTFYGKEYIKEMIVVSILFLAFFLLHPIVRMAHGSKITKIISGGKEVPPWKRFPIFLLAIFIIFGIKHLLDLGLGQMFPEHSINIVLVVFWLIALFSIYYLIFSEKTEEAKPEPEPPRNKRIPYYRRRRSI